MRLRVRAEISEAGRARFDIVVTDLSSHSQPHKLVMENISHYIIFSKCYSHRK